MAKFNLGDKVLCKNISYDGDTWSGIVTNVVYIGDRYFFAGYDITFDYLVVPKLNTTNARGPQGGMSSIRIGFLSVDMLSPYTHNESNDMK